MTLTKYRPIQLPSTLSTISTTLLCFSIPCLGTSAITVFSIIPIVLWFFTFKYNSYFDTLKTYPFTFISLLLFLYLGVSLLWSEHFLDGISILKKYREFVFLPIFLIYFSNPQCRKYGLIALYAGMVITLFISYLVYYGVITSPPRQHSLDNRIFNGILLSFFAYWSLSLSLEYKKYKLPLICLFILSFFCIFNIREGQTGQVLLIALSFLFMYQNWKWKGFFKTLIFLIPFSYYFLLYTSQGESLIVSANNLSAGSLDISSLAKFDIRLEYYINTLRIFMNHWLFGVGIGDFPSAYLSIQTTHEHFWEPTQNAHNEFLMIASQTGILGLTLFLLFFTSLFKNTFHLTPNRSKIAIAALITVAISCTFNSSFLDNNDGVLLMILIALFSVPPTRPSPNTLKHSEQ